MNAANSQAPAPAKSVICPSCGARSVYTPSNRWRPFCSQRCKNIDLGAWASERFRVPSVNPLDPQTPEDETPSSASH